MKATLLVSAVCALALSAPLAFAQDKHAHDKPAMSMDMEKMKAMQSQMDAIRTATDPAVRQRLMGEHMKSMRENMKAMHAMGGPKMQGGMMKDGKKGGMKEGEMMKHHAMMEHRMDMMHLMMDQMMQHEHAAHSMPAK